MPTGKDLLENAVGTLSLRKRNVVATFTGVLGIVTGGSNVVDVPGRAGFVWVRLRNVNNEVIQAFNENVSPTYDLPVVVERDKDQPNRYRVLGRDTERYQTWPSTSSYLPRHGNQHSFNKEDTGTGGDVVWSYSQQFLPFLVMPSGSSGSLNVRIHPYTYLASGTFHYAGDTGTASLLAYKPSGTTSARMILVYLDKTTGNFPLVGGSEFDESATGTATVVGHIPTVPADGIPLAGIRLVTGTSAITWSNIYDVRQFIS